MKTQIKEISAYILLLFFAIASLFLTLPHDVIDIDSSQYAEIAREMVETNNFFELKDNGKNYLDKPILTIWTIVLSYKLFGISNISYRLPALLITILSFYSIYRITVLISNSKKRGILASLSYAIAPGVFAMLIDPKIDIYLVGYLLFTFHMYYLGVKKNPNWFLLMYLYISMGFITKGPISIVIPALAIGGDILLRRDWNLLGKMKIIPGLFIVASLSAIWSYLLYLEFSFHGPIFFLWIQSFGRFYRQMYNQKFDPLYFISNFSWAFGIFILPLFYTCYLFLKEYKKETTMREIPNRVIASIRDNSRNESYYVISIWLFVFLFLISFSRYQLPQYIYWALPAGAIYISRFLEEYLFEKSNAPLFKREIFSFLLLVVPLFLLIGVSSIPIFIMKVDITFLILVAFLAIGIFYFQRRIGLTMSFSVLAPIFFYSVINIFIYPKLVSFQPSQKIGEIVKILEPEKKEIFTYKIPFSKRSYSFYSARLTKPIFDREKFLKIVEKDSNRLVVMSKEDLTSFKIFLQKDYLIEEIAEYPSYKVATPKIDFFLENKREGLTKNILLVKVNYVQEQKIDGRIARNKSE